MAKQNAKSQSSSPKASPKGDSSIKDKTVFLDKDVNKQYPVKEHDLANFIVYQYTERKVLETVVKLPATHVNPIGMYTPEEYAEHIQKGGLFDRLGLKHEVWNTPKGETIPEVEETEEEESEEEEPEV
ncbi:hypothetical protein GCM10028805_22590 [Spirosoma harenae]